MPTTEREREARRAKLTVERWQGGWEIAAIWNGYRVSHRYLYYTRREAVRLFRAYLATL